MPLACFQCVDKLLLASKHAEGMSLRYDEIANLTHSVILWVQYKFFREEGARRNSVRNLMCVGRYAAKVMRNERSEM